MIKDIKYNRWKSRYKANITSRDGINGTTVAKRVNSLSILRIKRLGRFGYKKKGDRNGAPSGVSITEMPE